MGWAGHFGSLALAPALLYVGSILWVIGYDTIYAHQDKEDDALVGVRSTARLFGDRTKPALALLYMGALLSYARAFGRRPCPFLPISGPGGSGESTWGYQIRVIDIDDGDSVPEALPVGTRSSAG